ncbi:MAG: hypothetical protein E2586_01855 [Novosphingobium sp.]|nr:hypothetical protein [Novosphingobium sp.]MPS67228.1 hypothetical protein [Novosphingobium sp.]
MAIEAEESFGSLDRSQPSLADPSGAGQLIMTIDADLLAAAKAGPAALHALLQAAEDRHFAARRRAIVTTVSGNAA